MHLIAGMHWIRWHSPEVRSAVWKLGAPTGSKVLQVCHVLFGWTIIRFGLPCSDLFLCVCLLPAAHAEHELVEWALFDKVSDEPDCNCRALAEVWTCR